MKPFECYVYTIDNDKRVVYTTRRPPWKIEHKSTEYIRAIKKWKQTFMDVHNAHWNDKMGLIIINNPRDNKIEESPLMIAWGGKCLATLTEKGEIEISCVYGICGWTAGHGTGGDTPEEAISYHNKYVEWLKIRKPNDFPPKQIRK